MMSLHSNGTVTKTAHLCGKPRQELKQEAVKRNCCRDHWGSHFLVCSFSPVAFLIQPWPIHPEMVPPTVGRVLFHQLVIKQTPLIHTNMANLTEAISQQSPSS